MKMEKFTRSQRGKIRRLKRRLARRGEVIHSVMPSYPPPDLWFVVRPADGSLIGRYFLAWEGGQWMAWQSHAQARMEREELARRGEER